MQLHPKMGWDEDVLASRKNVNATKERKTVLAMALSINETVKDGLPVNSRVWKNFCSELHAHMSNMSANQFLDGVDGKFAQPLVDALFNFDEEEVEELDFMDEDSEADKADKADNVSVPEDVPQSESVVVSEESSDEKESEEVVEESSEESVEDTQLEE